MQEAAGTGGTRKKEAAHAAAREQDQPQAEAAEVVSIPLVLLKETVIFPYTRMTINIGRDRSVAAVKVAHGADGQLIAGAQRVADVETPGPEDAFEVATLTAIRQYEPQSDGTIQVIFEGVSRVRITKWLEREPYPSVTYEGLPEPEFDATQAEALIRAAHDLFERFTHLSRNVTSEDAAKAANIHTPGMLADVLASMVITSDFAQRQELLETIDPVARLEKLCVQLGNEIEILELENKIRQRVRQQVDKNQREYYLKEQLRAIQEELGNDQASEVQELREKVLEKGMPPDVLAKVNKEIDRLERMPSHSAEVVVLRNYLDWMLALPWKEETDDRLDMAYAQKVLDDEHFGLEKVKERIVEFLAVRQLRTMREQQEEREREAGGAAEEPVRASRNSNKGPILCLIGPPGVGKTSLGQSVAKALNRKLIRISLGGVHDEAEIRGHRRTYVGALPGRIIQGMKNAGVRNPVFLLDEIDKLTADYRGDPSAALLEVLDPEQNANFTDHYLEAAYDLSEVFFICTGNNRYQIPRALADRMDIVEIPGYTEEEKVSIGRNFLLPRVLGEHGLTKDQVRISDAGMRFIVNRYTREAGVRNLERQLATICRKAALRIVQKPETHLRLSEKNIEQYLGIPRYSPDKAPEAGQVGVVTGLAWTANGGALLPVEVVTMPGKGSLMITGQLGDVMQESARAGVSFIRSRARELRLPEDFPNNLDIHIHLPEGAIPKDGPSAGITMATAIISALTRRPVRSDIAMTGEITLRGRVLPIGGLKEKALAAHRVGIKHLLVPLDNEKDIAEIPAKIRADMHFTLVESMDEVIENALLDAPLGPTETGERLVRLDAEPVPPPPVIVQMDEEPVPPPASGPDQQHPAM